MGFWPVKLCYCCGSRVTLDFFGCFAAASVVWEDFYCLLGVYTVVYDLLIVNLIGF